MLRERSATTDPTGHAVFHYRVGLAPHAGEVTFTEPGGARSVLKIPLAAVSYLDLLLVTPQEYDAYKKRQASAAPIYKLTLSAFPMQLAADGGSISHITATLTFTDGRPAKGVPLKADVSGNGGRIDTSQVATDVTGRMSFYFTAGREPGNATVRILEPSTGLVTTASILLVEAGPARIQILPEQSALSTDHDGTLLPANGFTQLPLTIKVTDLSGSALGGVKVKLEVLDMGSGWIELRDPVSNAFGEIHAIYHVGASTGKVRLRAYASAGLPAAP